MKLEVRRQNLEVRRCGFTLIELLITSSIIIILSGASLATFINYQDRREVNDEANKVADRLRSIQSKAVAVEIPPLPCTSVTNYTVSMTDASLTVSATCPSGPTSIDSLELTLANAVFVGNYTVTFDSRTISASAETIDICGNGNLYRIDVNEAANVGKPVWVSSC